MTRHRLARACRASVSRLQADSPRDRVAYDLGTNREQEAGKERRLSTLDRVPVHDHLEYIDDDIQDTNVRTVS
jgi:hypothetical protein